MKAVFVTALLLLSTFAVAQKDKSQRPSPAGFNPMLV